MDTIFLDFESFYDNEYSLKKMSPVEYILDDRWETIGCAVALNDGPFRWMEGDAVAEFLYGRNSRYAVVTHNALFDACVLAFRYGIYPDLCIDTMSMARALLSAHLPRGSVSLDTVSEYLGVGQKGDVVHNVKGMRLADFHRDPALYQSYQHYSCNDGDLCRGIFHKLRSQFPADEYRINHMVIEMATRPQFQIDSEKLYQYAAEIKAQKDNLLDSLGISKADLMSNDKFAVALASLGVDPPMKVSKTTGKETYAFAKNDPGFAALEDHDNPDVQLLVAARIGHKSTIEETRTQRFINISNVTRDSNGDSWMPIPLKFSGAHTHRFSGDWSLNAQNLKRGGTLRKALKAPPGYKVMTVDASQIEARLTAKLCGQQDLVKQFRDGADVYSIFATTAYGYEVHKKTHPNERHVGKRCILGLGFGAGGPVLNQAIFADNRDFGLGIDMDLQRASYLVEVFRGKYRNIAAKWRYLNGVIPLIETGRGEGTMIGPCVLEKGAILLPNGLRLLYPDLRYIGGNWTYQSGRERKKLYGGKLLENIVQALDRVFVMAAALRIMKRCADELGLYLRMSHQVHDEVVFVVPDDFTEEVKAIMLEEMGRPPMWDLELPVASEVGIGQNYGEAK